MLQQRHRHAAFPSPSMTLTEGCSYNDRADLAQEWRNLP